MKAGSVFLQGYSLTSAKKPAKRRIWPETLQYCFVEQWRSFEVLPAEQEINARSGKGITNLQVRLALQPSRINQ
jgi:hypothetical protein